MTRKDYVRIADALAATRPDPKWDAATYQWLATLHALADTLQLDNDRFDRDRFVAHARQEATA